MFDVVRRLALPILAAALLASSPTASAQWRDHIVLRTNCRAAWRSLPARHQIVTEAWNRVVAVPYIAYMPEKNRVLMLANCDYPHQAVVLWSDDRGATWTKPRFLRTSANGSPDTGMAVGLTYLGAGVALAYADGTRFRSEDFGATWTALNAVDPTAEGKPFYQWDPALVSRGVKGGAAAGLIETGYTMDSALYESATGPGYSHGHLRASIDAGKTWCPSIKVPQWRGVSEVALLRTRSGALLAACRTDIPARIRDRLDHYEGLAVARSTDGGRTWSALDRLYEYGRHHPCLVQMRDGTIVMTYVVRRGYTDSPDGFVRFGIEAIVSRDDGKTWDLDHRYVLARWTGTIRGANAWYPSSQATSTVLLPDGSLLTAYGTGYRCNNAPDGRPAPRDVGLVRWRRDDRGLDSDRTISSAPWNSETRNLLDPGSGITNHPEGARGGPERVCDGLSFPEGPAWNGRDSVFVSNSGADHVTRAGIDGTVEPTWMAAARGDTPQSFRKTNGMTFYRDGSLFVCDFERKAVLRIRPDRSCEVYADACEGRPFQGPNDLAFDPKGRLYFTDPTGSSLANPIGSVYCISEEGKRVTRVAEGMAFPNGIAFSADARTLYACESLRNRVVRFAVRSDGTLGQMEPFAELSPAGEGQPDGMAVDRAGRLWVAHFGSRQVLVVAPDGRIERRVRMPDVGPMGPTNVEFAGRDLRWLYITDPGANALYRMRVDTPGLRLFCSPRG